MPTDAEYMLRACELALRGAGHVSPNPLVGAVVVKDGRIIGEGWHECYGQPHAERNALARCTEDPAGATIYVTLEPCCHQGKQPPCTDAVIQAGISRVVMGSADPNPLVAGKGVAILRAAGIQVDEDVQREACDALNQAFFHHVTTGMPYVIAKYAMSLDGKIAPAYGQAFWLTGEQSLARVHQDRNRYGAVMVGVETVLVDDPRLTCRAPQGRNPLRVVVDSSLRTPLTCNVVASAVEVPTLIATVESDPEKIAPYQRSGVECLTLPEDASGRVSLPDLLKALGSRGIDSVIAEGGPTLHASLFELGLVNRVQTYVAGMVLGASNAPAPVCAAASERTAPAAGNPWPIKLSGAPEVTVLGADVLIEREVR